jgi:hypothetical protein
MSEANLDYSLKYWTFSKWKLILRRTKKRMEVGEFKSETISGVFWKEICVTRKTASSSGALLTLHLKESLVVNFLLPSA